VCEQPVLDALHQRAPVHAVLGNNDRMLRGRLPEALEVELDGVRIGLVHDAGPPSGRATRMARRFPDADVVVFGHSHAPLLEASEGGPLLVNPGSPTQRRRQPVHTVAWLEVADGEVRGAQVVKVGPLAR
jgi:putative phosphoesterase